ncbi:hypothetical protein Pmani_013578 [Petrolisthes manimaculis]|uniref:Protein Star n=1 Tax=Petrolisthes manimaculis TaxID=1843537 RepID=A0AAE1PUM6_9EUCA|nr:hypothetical protein Pmani_013578 [Petrolisthes manimaculis]
MRPVRKVKLLVSFTLALAATTSMAFIFISITVVGRGDLLEALLEGPLDAADPRLLYLVRERYLVAPASAPYNLKEDYMLPVDQSYLSYRNSSLGWEKLHLLVVTLFDHQPPGFFVEAGALDGEYLSNTLYLERNKNWTGLLVEPDAEMFKYMLEKNRKAWASHSCLATTNYPSKVMLYGCVEEEVAQAFWGSTVTVDVWLVEHHNPYSSNDTYDDTFIKIFEIQGYSVYTIITELQPFNYVFIRQNSTLHDAAFAIRPSEFDFKHGI